MKSLISALALSLAVCAAVAQETVSDVPAPPAEEELAPMAEAAVEPAPEEPSAPAPAETVAGPAAKFVVFLPERVDRHWYWYYFADESQHVVQSAVEKALVLAGLDVVDVGVASFGDAGSIEQLVTKDFAVAQAKQMGATHVVVGTAIADEASKNVAYGVTVVRANASITAKLVRVSDGKILAVEDATANAGGQAIEAAGREALKTAGDNIASKLARAAVTAAAP